VKKGTTRNLFLERKALPKEHICFSFSTGFLFLRSVFDKTFKKVLKEKVLYNLLVS